MVLSDLCASVQYTRRVRTACIQLPGAALQAALRAAPHLAGRPLVLAHGPRVVAASRAARHAGVTLDMTVVQARALCPDLAVTAADPARLESCLAGLADALGALSARTQVDHDRGAVFVQLPAGARGPTFAEHALEIAGRLGLIARAGVADDWFTAWAATQAEPRVQVRCVPAGGAAAFLSPLPLALLPLDPDVQHTLRLLGVRRLGEFAALPPPSVGRRWSAGTLDLQDLARGSARRALSPSPPLAIAEKLEVAPAVAEPDALSFLLLPLVDRACARLTGRGRTARALRVVLAAGARETVIQVEHEAGSVHARTWVDLVRARLGQASLAVACESIVVEVLHDEAVSAAREAEAEDLFAHARAQAGGKHVTTPAPRPRQAAKKARPQAEPDLLTRAAPPTLRVVPLPTPEPGALRVIEPPEPLAAQGERPGGAPESVIVDEQAHKVVAALGPTRLEAEWAAGGPVARDYWELTLDDGRRLWVFRDRHAGGVYLAGIHR
jgi:protein ImuB